MVHLLSYNILYLLDRIFNVFPNPNVPNGTTNVPLKKKKNATDRNAAAASVNNTSREKYFQADIRRAVVIIFMSGRNESDAAAVEMTFFWPIDLRFLQKYFFPFLPMPVSSI